VPLLSRSRDQPNLKRNIAPTSPAAAVGLESYWTPLADTADAPTCCAVAGQVRRKVGDALCPQAKRAGAGVYAKSTPATFANSRKGVISVMSSEKLGAKFQKSQLDAVDEEIARLSYLCDIRLLEPGNIERVIAGDETVCGKANPMAFKKLHNLAKVHYMLTEQTLKLLGPEETTKKLAEIRARLQTRFNLGGEVR
jgi:hypothetical protein